MIRQRYHGVKGTLYWISSKRQSLASINQAPWCGNTYQPLLIFPLRSKGRVPYVRMRQADAICGMRYAVCGMRYAVCGMRYAVCGMRYAVCGMRKAVCGNKWLQWERIGVSPYVRLRFVVRMRQTESVHVAIHNVSAHESDRKFQGVTSLQTGFPQLSQLAGGISGKT